MSGDIPNFCMPPRHGPEGLALPLLRIEERLSRIERILSKLLDAEIDQERHLHAVVSLGLKAGTPVPIKPPTQGVGVPGSDQGAVGNVSAPPNLTTDMRSIMRLINEPHVRMLLLREAKVEPPEQVQHQRVLCERIVLSACGAKTLHDLVSGVPAHKLQQLVHRLAVFSGGF
jgi:hypothetical protein